jgi:hypothetical protein
VYFLAELQVPKLVCYVSDRQTDRQAGRQAGCLDPESQRVVGPVGGY